MVNVRKELFEGVYLLHMPLPYRCLITPISYLYNIYFTTLPTHTLRYTFYWQLSLSAYDDTQQYSYREVQVFVLCFMYFQSLGKRWTAFYNL